MRFSPRAYQHTVALHAITFLTSATRGSKIVYSSPTGSGKSIPQIMVLGLLPNGYLITPRIEIALGLLDKIGYTDLTDMSLDRMIALAQTHKIYTPTSFRNRLVSGLINPLPTYIIFDETHHYNAETYGQIDLLCGYPPSIGFTATPFRGNAAQSKLFRDVWGEPVVIMTFPEAIELGVISMPNLTTIPLIDDDVIEVSNGEFQVSSIESEYEDKYEDIVSLINSYPLDKPTFIAAPSRNIAGKIHTLIPHSSIVDSDTPYAERLSAFNDCISCRNILIQIRVVSEGIDLPLRRMIDLIPRLSPVDWLQSFGRITRPNGQSEYVCTNRNLLRHSYLLEGMVPQSTIIEATNAFAGMGERKGKRVGMEALGRFKPVDVMLTSGMIATCYFLSSFDPITLRRSDYACIAVPNQPAIWSERVTTTNEQGEKQWGKWQDCTNPPSDVQGFQSAKPISLSEKQAAWWDRKAASFGIDPSQDVNAKVFQLLPVLSDLRRKLK